VLVRSRKGIAVEYGKVLGRWQRRMFRRSDQVNQRRDLLGASD
jgi:hypothetical protein